MDLNICLPPEILYKIVEDNFKISLSLKTFRLVCKKWGDMFAEIFNKLKRNDYLRLKESVWAKPFYPKDILYKIKEKEIRQYYTAINFFEKNIKSPVGFISLILYSLQNDLYTWGVRVYLYNTLWDNMDHKKSEYIKKYLNEHHKNIFPKKIKYHKHSIFFVNKEFDKSKNFVITEIAGNQLKLIRHLAKTVVIPSE